MNIIKLNATDSTNTYLKKMVRETSVADKTVVVVKDQTAGRGQRENKWQSKEGESLTFSVFKRFEGFEAHRQFMISMAVSLGVANAFESLNIPNVSIKWPNDILSEGKKVGAILIENVLEGSRIKHSVIGIGINVNEDSFDNLPQASSFKIQTGVKYNLEEVMYLVLDHCFQELNNLQSQKFSDLQQHYENYLFKKETISVFEDEDGNRFNGIIKGITDIGELLVQLEDESTIKVQIKQLKLIY